MSPLELAKELCEDSAVDFYYRLIDDGMAVLGYYTEDLPHDIRDNLCLISKYTEMIVELKDYFDSLLAEERALNAV